MGVDQIAARRARYELFGFDVLPGLLAPFVAGIFGDVDAVFAAGTLLRGSAERRSVANFLGRSPALTDAAAAIDLPGVAASLLDAPVVYLFGDASEYRGDTAWHADTDYANARLVKFVLYDSPLNADNGALRFLLGSHRQPQAYPTDGWADEEVPGYVVDVEPGDVIAFDPRLRHAALGGQVRRQVAITYAAQPTTPAAKLELMNLVLADQTVV